ncbi:MAG: Fe-S protein assembly co-chaperone HscB [Rhodoferax sp.]|nr:Fe-S protein assembly co-chaperone HscB [Rhodoferax sp.]
MNLQDNDFTLFGLPQRYAQDPAAVDRQWKALQRQIHPDRFVAAGSSAQRLAMQWSVRVNEAHQRLRNPLRRAAYLCSLAGVAVDTERNTAMPADFLQQQMVWREALDEAGSEADIDAIQADVDRARDECQQACERWLDSEAQPQRAAATVQAWMFIDRFAEDLLRRRARFEEGAGGQ